MPVSGQSRRFSDALEESGSAPKKRTFVGSISSTKGAAGQTNCPLAAGIAKDIEPGEAYTSSASAKPATACGKRAADRQPGLFQNKPLPPALVQTAKGINAGEFLGRCARYQGIRSIMTPSVIRIAKGK